MLTVLTWYWRQPGGRTQFEPWHVNVWAAMVGRHLAQPHRLACVTATPEGIDPSIEIIAPPRDFEDVTIPSWGPDKPQCLRRLAMFRADAAQLFGERFVCMDLDCVAAGPLDPLFESAADFRIFRGTTAGRPYNGSMMLLAAGARRQVYDRFTPAAAAEAGRRFTGSDQAWISHVLGTGEATWGPEDGVSWWRQGLTPEASRLMFFPGRPKPWTLVENGRHDWIEEHYRGAAPGRCLVLGYAAGIWDELAAVVGQGPFDAVIASPEAARHWPGQVLAIAADDRHAERLARMHGFAETVWCGRSERIAA